jgi:hypothetical protein
VTVKPLRPFFNYYGGKWRAANRYPPPRLPTIIEPFAGSAGYAVRHHERDVILIDTDHVVCGVWSYLIRASEAEILSLPIGIGHVDEVRGPPEAKALVGFWMGRASASPRLTPSAWMRTGKWDNLFWSANIRNRIASQVGKIRHWKVIWGTYGIAPDVPAMWFIDPPYQSACGRHYRHNDVNFPALAGWCRSRNGQVIVCEKTGADWLPFRHLATVQSAAKGYTAEAVWTK